jgi:hypothetical protein
MFIIIKWLYLKVVNQYRAQAGWPPVTLADLA